MPVAMEVGHYPPLFRTADALSLRSQKYQRQFIRGDLAFAVAAACAGCVPLLGIPLAGPAMAGLAAVGFLYIVLVPKLRSRRGDDRNWFNGRTVAETVKTHTWRYMM